MYNYTADREQMLNREMYYIWGEVENTRLMRQGLRKMGMGWG